MAFIEYQSSLRNSYLCSGTVVSPNVVLTAGHCAVDKTTGITRNPAGFAVVTGAADWTDTSNRQVSRGGCPVRRRTSRWRPRVDGQAVMSVAASSVGIEGGV